MKDEVSFEVFHYVFATKQLWRGEEVITPRPQSEKFLIYLIKNTPREIGYKDREALIKDQIWEGYVTRRTSRAKDTVDRCRKDFLTDAEMQRFLDAARLGRLGVQNYLLMLMAYRHGPCVSELIDLRPRDLALDTGRM